MSMLTALPLLSSLLNSASMSYPSITVLWCSFSQILIFTGMPCASVSSTKAEMFRGSGSKKLLPSEEGLQCETFIEANLK